MKRKIISVILAAVLLAGLAPSAFAAGYTSTKLGVKADFVANLNGYALPGEYGKNGETLWDLSLFDSSGKTVHTFPAYLYYTYDGYYFSDGVLYDSNFSQVLKVDPYALTHNGQSSPAGTDNDYYYFINNGVIAVEGENQEYFFFDYSGKLTGSCKIPQFENVLTTQIRIGDSAIVITATQDIEDGYGIFYTLYSVIVDKSGKILADLGSKFASIREHYEGLASSFAPVSYGEYEARYIDLEGNTILTVDANYLSAFSGGYASIGKETDQSIKYGVIDKLGNWVITPQYDYISPSKGNNVFYAHKNGKYGYIDINNNELVPFVFDTVSYYLHDIGYGVIDGELYAIKINADTADAPSSWAAESVNAAIAAGLVPQALQSGYILPATRAEFCALAVSLYEKVTGEPITGRSQFNDTTDVNVEKMAFLKVVNGVGDGNFAPDNELTREQAATMLARLAEAIGKPLAKQAATFADNGSVASWALESVGQVQAAGIMGGVGENTFAPQEPYSREQCIITIIRLFNIVK